MLGKLRLSVHRSKKGWWGGGGGVNSEIPLLIGGLKSTQLIFQYKIDESKRLAEFGEGGDLDHTHLKRKIWSTHPRARAYLARAPP